MCLLLWFLFGYVSSSISETSFEIIMTNGYEKWIHLTIERRAPNKTEVDLNNAGIRFGLEANGAWMESRFTVKSFTPRISQSRSRDDTSNPLWANQHGKSFSARRPWTRDSFQTRPNSFVAVKSHNRRRQISVLPRKTEINQISELKPSEFHGTTLHPAER